MNEQNSSSETQADRQTNANIPTDEKSDISENDKPVESASATTSSQQKKAGVGAYILLVGIVGLFMFISAASVAHFVQRFNAYIDDTTEEEKRDFYRTIIFSSPEIHTYMQELDKEVDNYLKDGGATPHSRSDRDTIDSFLRDDKKTNNDKPGDTNDTGNSDSDDTGISDSTNGTGDKNSDTQVSI